MGKKTPLTSDLHPEPSADGNYLPANGLEIFYRQQGQGRPLVLLHGATDTHRLWDPYLEDLSGHFRVIMPDGRGHGRTLNPTRQLSYRLLADDLAGFILGLELEKPFIFGYSDGGQAVLDFALRYSGLAGALAMGGVWYRLSAPYLRAISEAGFVGPGEIDYRVYEGRAPSDWELRLRLAHLDPDPDYPRILLEGLSRMWWTPLNYTAEDLGDISDPCLILVGEKDKLVPPAEGRELAALIPGAELSIIPDAGHSGVLQKGGNFLPVLKDFFDRQGC
jgi:pimeloyl-ACP methyl ester carboxylesterase